VDHTPDLDEPDSPPARRRIWSKIIAIGLGIPVGLLLGLYLVLLVTPIPLPFMAQQVRNLVLSSLPPGSQLELGEMALTVEGGTLPVIRFEPVTYTDTTIGATVRMAALEVGFSPLRTFVGQPGAVVTLVGPHIQVNQDLFGPRLASFEIERDDKGAPTVIRVLEGSSAFPAVDFSSEGIAVRGEMPAGAGPKMRSDNDWLIYNLEAAEKGVADIMMQARNGVFSRLVIRDGTLEMNDAVYGVFRTFEDITLDIAPTPSGRAVEGEFSADFGGTVMRGTIERAPEADGQTHLKASLTNIDFSSFVPFIDDEQSMVALEGSSALSMDVTFEARTGKLVGGRFHVDVTGTDLRIEDDFFPVASSIMQVDWEPTKGQFTLAETEITVGQSSGTMSGVFLLGLDELYGPTVGISMNGSDLRLHPYDMAAPETPFSTLSFTGWSAPLYGAMGIDQFKAEKADGAQIASKGRIDMLRRGMGFEMTVAGQGITADDLKRLWPYFLAKDTRDWFVKNITAGIIESSTMKYSFPVGTLVDGQPLPANSMSIDMVGRGVHIIPVASMAPLAIDGRTILQVRDSDVTIAADGARLDTANGAIAVANAAMVMDSSSPQDRVIEISGDLSGAIPALVALAKEQQPDALAQNELPIDLDGLEGNLTLGLVATILLDDKGATKNIDYAINGRVQDFASAAPIEDFTINNGQLSFSATQAGYRVGGKADVQGLTADLVIEGKMAEQMPPPEILLSATLNANDLKKMGFDASEFLTGDVTFVARPMPDGSVQMAIDLEDAALTVKDIGVSKAKGVAGSFKAAVRQEGDLTNLSQIDLAFGDVTLKGGLQVDAKKGLQSAQFTSFSLNPGDSAQLSLTPINDGYEVRLRGQQLDLKPMLGRFFSLEQGTGGPQATAVNQTIVVDAQLDRALGFYRTTAYNVDLDLSLRGTDLRRVGLQAQLGNDRSISVTTNTTPSGRAMSVAFNDMGTLLRFLNVYPNVEGGEGVLVLDTNTSQKVDRGQFSMRNFAIVDEDNVAQVLGNHNPSRQLISRQNKLSFRSGQVDFVRRVDRLEVVDAVLSGDMVGGTMRGFIYTDRGQYDLTGTYVPLFGLNNAFQKLPIFGPLLGGRDGEGLFGVTFAVRGPLDKPNFVVNPLSALVPGAFRGLFEYRAREEPRQQQ
jgi:hypothetical protein